MNSNKRCTNFSTIEEKHLLGLVFEFKDKIENKKIDTDVNRLKNDAWKAIEQEFNIVEFENDRTALVLKRKYENLNKKTITIYFGIIASWGLNFNVCTIPDTESWPQLTFN
jgi:hypothetical protein